MSKLSDRELDKENCVWVLSKKRLKKRGFFSIDNRLHWQNPYLMKSDTDEISDDQRSSTPNSLPDSALFVTLSWFFCRYCDIVAKLYSLDRKNKHYMMVTIRQTHLTLQCQDSILCAFFFRVPFHFRFFSF